MTAPAPFELATPPMTLPPAPPRAVTSTAQTPSGTRPLKAPGVSLVNAAACGAGSALAGVGVRSPTPVATRASVVATLAPRRGRRLLDLARVRLARRDKGVRPSMALAVLRGGIGHRKQWRACHSSQWSRASSNRPRKITTPYNGLAREFQPYGQ